MTEQSPVNGLHQFLGISQERFDTKIAPMMNEITRTGMKVDLALLKIEKSGLSQIEKQYCSYAIGRVVGIDEINKRSLGLARKLGLK